MKSDDLVLLSSCKAKTTAKWWAFSDSAALAQAKISSVIHDIIYIYFKFSGDFYLLYESRESTHLVLHRFFLVFSA